ncbi:amidase [Alkalimonas collagenimarina]|uniref:Amidase n=1 Tax=Alkalimonas collagenimarina TaxID=400390 RepID=A0ABT9H4K7_9GAMM|nr:amidase [Alkalimonas collagenimarina]MDP4537835.1 amidase [Alkalimonas collagenimarina]
MSIHYLAVTETLKRFRDHSLSPVELMQAYQQRITALDPTLNAFTSQFTDDAMLQANQAQQSWLLNDAKPLSGLAVAIKDETFIEGQITTNGSRLLTEAMATTTDPVPARLLQAGAIVHGRTTTPEFSTAGVTWSELWGVSRNPWNPAISCGGSSGGSAIAVATGMCSFANGTDIGGSVRIPAAFCGLYGYKPPHGRVPEISPYNIDPYCHHSLLTRTLDDLLLLYPFIKGPDWIDSHSFIPDENPQLTPRKPLQQLKVALSPTLGFYQVADDIRRELDNTAEELRQLGIQVDLVEPAWDERVIETAKIHQRALMGMTLKHAFGAPDTRKQLTSYAQSYLAMVDQLTVEDIFQANLHSCSMWDALAVIFRDYDLLICPTLATSEVPAHFDYSKDQMHINGQQVDANKGWFMTYPFNTLGQCPVLSMPNGFCDNGVPSSVQIVGRPYQEADVFQLAKALSNTVAKDFYNTRFPKL